MAANKVLSSFGLTATSSVSGSDTIVTVNGQGTPAGATVAITITFDNDTSHPVTDSTTISTTTWTKDVNVGQHFGQATVEADVTAGTFPNLAATSFDIITVPQQISVKTAATAKMAAPKKGSGAGKAKAKAK